MRILVGTDEVDVCMAHLLECGGAVRTAEKKAKQEEVSPERSEGLEGTAGGGPAL